LCQPCDEVIDEDIYAVAIEINVTANSVEHAVELALSDLRDPDMEWTDFTVTLPDSTVKEVKR
jgi:hypothetical protein